MARSEMKCGVIVLGQGRTGTSAVAGVLYRLGVFMGDSLSHNWEDSKLMRLHEAMIGDWKNPRLDAKPCLDKYREFFADRQHYDLWGVKDPRLCFTFPVLVSLLQPKTDDVKVVVTSRPMRSIIASLACYPGVKSHREAWRIAELYSRALSQAIAKIPAGWPSLTVKYNDLVDAPQENVIHIADFIGVQVTNKAVKVVKPALRHHR
jgi:hypothetical protein